MRVYLIDKNISRLKQCVYDNLKFKNKSQCLKIKRLDKIVSPNSI